MEARMDKSWKRTWMVILVFVVVWMLWNLSRMELYCPFYPSIDTRYAPHYDEERFSQVKPGMARDEVIRLLGKPLHEEEKKNGAVKWYYSADGGCSWGDFAWLARSVFIDEGVVVEVEKRVYYD
jgi:hypothetical protein